MSVSDEKSSKRSRQSASLGKNIFAFSPIQILVSDADQVNPDLAINVSYERIFNNNILSFRLPVCFSLINKYYYFMPTLKIYPFKQGIVRYAVGPQILFATGKFLDERYLYDPNTGQYVYNNKIIDRKQFGFLINNSVNVTIVKSMYVGVDASIGIIYYDNLPKNYYSSGMQPLSSGTSNINPMFQIHFNAGYRF